MLIGHSLCDGAGNILAIDVAVCDLMHRTRRQVVGSAYVLFTHPEDRTRAIRFVTQLQGADGVRTIRKRYIRPDETSISADITVSRLVAGDGQTRIVGSVEIVTRNEDHDDPLRLWTAAQRAWRVMKKRRSDLGEELFLDYPFMILLLVYTAEVEGRFCGLRSISEQSGLREASTVRWIKVLQEKGLIEPPMQSGSVPQLTAIGFSKIEHVLASEAR